MKNYGDDIKMSVVDTNQMRYGTGLKVALVRYGLGGRGVGRSGGERSGRNNERSSWNGGKIE